MNSKLKILIILFFIAFIAVAYLMLISESVEINNKSNNNISKDENRPNDFKEIEKQNKEIEVQGEVEIIKEDKQDENLEINNDSEILNIVFDVPFTPQSPFADWDDPIFQDGCEEAVALMAVSWARGESLNQTKAKNEIVAASSYQTENYGEYRDASVEDTVKRIIKGYFAYKNVNVKNNITIEDIIFELINGNLIILPMNGQELRNPYYTPPGPERHMIVVIGYDEEKKEFITNDPGTKRGEEYRYNEDILFSAVRDYYTGYHVEINDVRKNMIIVTPEKK